MLAKKIEKFEKAGLRTKKEIKIFEEKISKLQMDLDAT